MDKIGKLIPRTFTARRAEQTLRFKQKWLNQGFTQISNSLLRNNEVSSQARFLYMLLMSRCFSKDFSYPGQETLGKEMGVSDRQIRRYLAELTEAKWVSVKRRGLGKPNLYLLEKYK